MIAAVANLTMEELEKNEPPNLYRGPICSRGGADGISQAFYLPDTLKWLSIGTMYDHPKSWTFMGGGVAPGEGAVIQYVISAGGDIYCPEEHAPDRKQKISWYFRDGYQPCPVSIWKARGIEVRIEHFAVRDNRDVSTIIYSKIRLTNHGNDSFIGKLLVNAGPRVEFPISVYPAVSSPVSMEFKVSMETGEYREFEFAAGAAGEALDADHPEKYGRYEENYLRMAEGNNEHIARLAHPTELPRQGIINMYKSIQIQLWNYVVKQDGECQIRSNAGNPARIQSYDRPFPHDIPNIVDEFMREGDYELGREILASKTYRRMNSSDLKDWDDLNYMDTIGKFILPYAQYLQNTGDTAFFDEELRGFLKKAAWNIHALRVFDDPEHAGLMRKGEDFENWSDDGDYLLADNWQLSTDCNLIIISWSGSVKKKRLNGLRERSSP